MLDIRMYLGTPQTTLLPVYKAPSGRNAIVKRFLFTNLLSEGAKVTVTVNTVDVIKDLELAAKETKIIDFDIPLEGDETLSLRQDKENGINVTISGVLL
ncbi:hypothetical protein [Bacillus pacificus]|uniref:hypothetical protein n=1 Tax=Bacillus pacificus TaxID=2026187 RepID=UPI003D657F8D